MNNIQHAKNINFILTGTEIFPIVIKFSLNSSKLQNQDIY